MASRGIADGPAARVVDQELGDSAGRGAGQLARMTDWARVWICGVLQPGDMAVDLTAGNGHDTAFLCRLVGAAGGVVAFDIQHQALQRTAERLREQGTKVTWAAPEGPPAPAAGALLVAACHSRLDRYVDGPVRAVMANLGYCPGGDHALVTRTDTSCAALRAALERLLPGGRITVLLYPGHAGGAEEAAAVRELFSALDAGEWQVMELAAVNRRAAPHLLLAARKA
jgi:predicted methyltransferase